MNCKIGSFPIQYLGLPLSYKNLPKSAWLPLISRIQSRLASWKGKLLSYGGRLTLINSVLSSLPSYFMSVFQLPSWVKKRIDQLRKGFLWKGKESAGGFHCLVNWDSVCKSKKEGGLGIKNISIMNKALLAKWVWKAISPKHRSPWKQAIVCRLRQTRKLAVRWLQTRRSASSVWKTVIKDQSGFWNCTSFKLGDGSSIRFWEDPWLNDIPLNYLFPDLYPSASRTNVSVADLWHKGRREWIIYFQGPLSYTQSNQEAELKRIISQIQPTDDNDLPVWKPSKEGDFSVKSFYSFLNSGGLRWPFFSQIWEAVVPDKIKIFAWLALRNRLQMGERLAKKGWPVSQGCLFCSHQPETISHILLSCPYAKLVWLEAVSKLHATDVPADYQDLWTSWRKSNIHCSLRKPWDQLVLAISWSLWKERNARLFQHACSPAIVTYRQALHLFLFWGEAGFRVDLAIRNNQLRTLLLS